MGVLPDFFECDCTCSPLPCVIYGTLYSRHNAKIEERIHIRDYVILSKRRCDIDPIKIVCNYIHVGHQNPIVVAQRTYV